MEENTKAYQLTGVRLIEVTIKEINIVLNNFLRYCVFLDEHVASIPCGEKSKQGIPHAVKFPHPEAVKTAHPAIIGGLFW